MVFALKHKKLVLIILSAITLFSFYNIKNISFEHNLESFFSKNDDEYKFSQEFFKQFGGGSASYKKLIIGIDNNALINYNFMKRVDNFTQEIKEKIQPQEVHSIINQKLFLFTSFGKVPYKIFHLNDSAQFNKDLAVLKNYPEISARYLSKNNSKTLLYIGLDNNINIDSLLSIKTQIKALSKKYHFNDLILFNTDLTKNAVENKLKRESIILTLISVCLVIIILLYFTRSFIGLIVPLSIVLICVIWILGTMGFLGVSLNVMSIAIPVIVGVISLSDVIHIISRYSEETSTDKIERIKLTQKDIFKAIVLTSVTTSFGFLSLIPSDIKIFVEFGFFTSLGVVFAFILAYFLLPIMLFYTKKINIHEDLLKTVPKKIYAKSSVFVLIAILCFVIIGIYNLKNDSYIYDDINAKDEVSKSIKTVNEDFYGIRDLSIAITVKNNIKNISDYNILDQLNKLQKYTDSLYKLNTYTSLVTLVSQMNRAKHGGKIEYFKIPNSELEYKEIIRQIENNKQYFTLSQFVSPNKKSTFIYAKIKDIGSHEISLKNELLRNYVSKNLSDLTVRITGGSHVQDETNFSVTETMFFSLFTIIALIFIIISVLFKSVKIGLISLLPNILPLLIILAVIGWFDLGINISTSIVFTIVFGIAVDDTIHFLSRYQIEKNNRVSNHQAILNTLQTSGGAISLTTIILITGFGVLMFSQFNVNYLTGLLVCIGLLTALLSDLFILPLLLKMVNKD